MYLFEWLGSGVPSRWGGGAEEVLGRAVCAWWPDEIPAARIKHVGDYRLNDKAGRLKQTGPRESIPSGAVTFRRSYKLALRFQVRQGALEWLAEFRRWVGLSQFKDRGGLGQVASTCINGLSSCCSGSARTNKEIDDEKNVSF